MRLHLLSDHWRTRILRSSHTRVYLSRDHISWIPDCSIRQGSLCPISRTRYHSLDTHTGFDQYMSQSQYSPPHWSDSPIYQLWWIVSVFSHDRYRDTPLDLSTYGVSTTESLRYPPCQATSHILKIPEFGNFLYLSRHYIRHPYALWLHPYSFIRSQFFANW